MARFSKTLTPAAQAAFVAALERGALVVAAAAAAGVAVSTLYCRRRRDRDFDSAWTAAVTASSGRAWQPRPGNPLRFGASRRCRLDERRRALFLAGLERACDTNGAAEEAGVHRSTVYRLIARDPDFASANEAALQRGYAGLERKLEAERQRPPRAIVATGRPTEDFDEAMRLLARWTRPASSGRVRPGRERWTFEDSIRSLERKLAVWDPGRRQSGG